MRPTAYRYLASARGVRTGEGWWPYNGHDSVRLYLPPCGAESSWREQNAMVIDVFAEMLRNELVARMRVMINPPNADRHADQGTVSTVSKSYLRYPRIPPAPSRACPTCRPKPNECCQNREAYHRSSRQSDGWHNAILEGGIMSKVNDVYETSPGSLPG